MKIPIPQAVFPLCNGPQRLSRLSLIGLVAQPIDFKGNPSRDQSSWTICANSPIECAFRRSEDLGFGASVIYLIWEIETYLVKKQRHNPLQIGPIREHSLWGLKMEAEFELSTAFSVESIFIYVSLIGSPATLSQALELLPFPAGIVFIHWPTFL